MKTYTIKESVMNLLCDTILDAKEESSDSFTTKRLEECLAELKKAIESK